MERPLQLDAKKRQILKDLAEKYIWWKTPKEAMAMPERVIVQVMDIGDYADVQALADLLDDDDLRHVLIHSEAGQLSERSWVYWHYRLGLADVESVPPMPERKVG